MISSAFKLKESNCIPEYLTVNMNTKIEENYYIKQSLDFLLECHKELLFYRQNFYKSILESSSNNPYLINEAFEDILTKIKNIIKKIIDYIKTLIDKFSTQFPKLVKSNKYLLKMKNEFNKFPKDKSFEITGFIFTIDDTVPVIDIVGLDLLEFKAKLESIYEKSSVINIIELEKLIEQLTNENKMDYIRGQILNLDRPIPSTLFNGELFSIFRDGKTDEDIIEIKKEDVLDSYKKFSEYDKKTKDAKKLQKQLQDKYKILERQIENIITIDMNTDGSSKIDQTIHNKYSQEDYYNLQNTLNNLLVNLISQIQRISNLHVLALSIKLDAYNAELLQNKNILYKALDEIRNINSTTVNNESFTDYTMDLSYKEYLLEKHFMDRSQNRFVKECLLLSESNIPELQAVNENLKTDISKNFDTLKETLGNLINKFLVKMEELFNSNTKFLEQNKDAILNSKVVDYIINDLPDYKAGIINIRSHKLQPMDFKVVSSEIEMQKKLLPAYKEEGDFKEFVKNYFLCDNKPIPKETKSSSLNMKELYEYCLDDCKNMKDEVKNDSKKYKSEADKVKNEILKSISESFTDIYGEKFYYSKVLESFINEDGENPNGEKKELTPSPSIESKDKSSNTDAKDDKTINTSVPKQDDNNDNSNNPDDKKEEKKEPSLDDKIRDSGKWYLSTLRTITTAKMTALQKIYNEYMKIMKYHVSQITKFSDDELNKLKDAMKDHINAKDENGRNSASDRIIKIYKEKGINIDNYAVQKLVDKNKGKLE